jgi:hypothetical protein
MSEQNILIEGRVTYDKSAVGVVNAPVRLYNDPGPGDDKAEMPLLRETCTEADGVYSIAVPLGAGDYVVRCTAFGLTRDKPFSVAGEEKTKTVHIELPLQLSLNFYRYTEQDGRLTPIHYALAERSVVAQISADPKDEIAGVKWLASETARITSTGREALFVFPRQGKPTVTATITDKGHDGRHNGGARTDVTGVLLVSEEVRTVDVRGDIGVAGHLRVTMERTDARRTPDEALWSAIDETCRAIGFEQYLAHIGRIFELGPFQGEISRKLRELGARGVGAYRALREATELFVLMGCGPLASRISAHEDARLRELGELGLQMQQSREEIEDGLRQYLHKGELPYIERVVNAAYPWLDLDGSGLDGLRRRVLRQPLFIELWHEMCLEHGMVMRTMDAVCARFQNIYNSGENDGLASYEISPLWPLGDLLWDWINHEPTRLNPKRRIHEYGHKYGRTVLGDGMAVRAADVRTAFPDAFMNLLNLCEEFYKQDSQTTVIADAFPVLVALREVHQILAMGAGNASPQLTFAARVETLMMQLMLAQPELRAFLHVREMVPYDEGWMGQVDAMKDLQGWQDQSISHYRDLAVYGERILLSIRLGDWTVGDEDNSKHWARVHKNAIRRFAHAHRAISGVELAPASRRPSARAALVGDGRAGMLRGRQQARSELSFADNLGRITPQLTSRGRLVD